MDAVNGGRLIYYDFGMMGTIAPTVKGGLLELFYGAYRPGFSVLYRKPSQLKSIKSIFGESIS